MTIGRCSRCVLGSYRIRPRNSSSVRFVLRNFFLDYFMLMCERLEQKCFWLDSRDTHGLFAGSQADVLIPASVQRQFVFHLLASNQSIDCL